MQTDLLSNLDSEMNSSLEDGPLLCLEVPAQMRPKYTRQKSGVKGHASPLKRHGTANKQPPTHTNTHTSHHYGALLCCPPLANPSTCDDNCLKQSQLSRQTNKRISLCMVHFCRFSKFTCRARGNSNRLVGLNETHVAGTNKCCFSCNFHLGLNLNQFSRNSRFAWLNRPMRSMFPVIEDTKRKCCRAGFNFKQNSGLEQT